MFVKLHGVLGARLLVNTDHVRAFQELVEGSKYAVNMESGAKSLIQIDDKLVPVKESIIQIENILKKADIFGGNS